MVNGGCRAAKFITLCTKYKARGYILAPVRGGALASFRLILFVYTPVPLFAAVFLRPFNLEGTPQVGDVGAAPGYLPSRADEKSPALTTIVQRLVIRA